jgi:2-polyprenyl-3-methyl-5-hydroxy-6-metoxy-1,4-benzoquinol methylase
MKPLDRFLWDWRLKQFLPYIPPGTRILDVGCAEGLMFQKLGARLGEGVGLDPALARSVQGARYRLIPGRFPDDYPETDRFDLITMIAVLEHLPAEDLSRVVQRCVNLLKSGGQVIVTVPSP